jgi:hypothetical protein
MSLVEFKVGTSFNVPIDYTPVAGLAPATLANTTITSQIRRATGEVIESLVATKLAGNMSFTLAAANGTHAWPPSITARWDIRFVDTVFGEFYSDTAELKLIRPVTRSA